MPELGDSITELIWKAAHNNKSYGLLDFIFSTEFKVVLTCFAVLNGYIILKMHTDKREY